ncbi:DUF2125 domain-containing protein [Paroceanicella profunda]|uniref:DUF2125 domain-containing protein n=1 Tax=Paroceanicella profunda TaxID=2579971 RepID=A0A5B8FHM3_9RHOB|nr:DUF2125 domain-containing protein [Paroceanicella profunda]QDL92327.1 DUF2125 domain-containing protein [Paroceanicella profunda]
MSSDNDPTGGDSSASEGGIGLNKVILGFLVVLGVGTAAWAGGWFYFRGNVRDMLDAEEERIATAGGTVTYDSRIIGGFPLSYEVEYAKPVITLPGEAVRIQAPWMRGTATAFDSGAVLLAFPEKMTLTVTPPQGSGPIVFDVTSSGLTSVARLATDGGTDHTVTASSLEIAQQTPAEIRDGQMQAEDFKLDASVSADQTNVSGTLTASSLALAYSLSPTLERLVPGSSSAGDAVSTSRFSYEAYKADFAVDMPEGDSLSSLTSGATSVSLSLGAKSTAVDMTVPSLAGPVHMSGESGPSSALYSIEDGVVELSGRVADLDYTLDFSDPAVPIDGAGITGKQMEARLALPLGMREEAQEFALGLSLSDLEMDDALWDLFDDGKVLPRDPAELSLDMSGMGRWTQDPAGFATTPPEPGSNPLDMESVKLGMLELSLAGARISATGEATMDNSSAAPFPEGSVDVTLSGFDTLTGKLGDMGLLSPQELALVRGLASAYTQPGTEPDTLQSTVEMRGGSVLINGLPLQ